MQRRREMRLLMGDVSSLRGDKSGIPTWLAAAPSLCLVLVYFSLSLSRSMLSICLNRPARIAVCLALFSSPPAVSYLLTFSRPLFVFRRSLRRGSGSARGLESGLGQRFFKAILGSRLMHQPLFSFFSPARFNFIFPLFLASPSPTMDSSTESAMLACLFLSSLVPHPG
ncbi:hypothetical protein BDV12DRAFT_92494 [Aspergillus spectabilis]